MTTREASQDQAGTWSNPRGPKKPVALDSPSGALEARTAEGGSAREGAREAETRPMPTRPHITAATEAPGPVCMWRSINLGAGDMSRERNHKARARSPPVPAVSHLSGAH